MAYEFVPLSQDTEEDSKPYSFVPLEVEARREPAASPVKATRVSATVAEPDTSNAMGDDFGAAIMAQNPSAATEVNRASSVLTGRVVEKPAPLIEQRGAPVSEDRFNQLKKAYDAATPNEREALLKAPGANGTVFKTIADQYKKLDTSIEKTPTAKVFDTRREARRDRLIDQGMEAKSADALATKEAGQGGVSQPLAQAKPSTFDFETKAEFARPENKLVQEETGGLITARTIKPSGLDELTSAGKAAYGKVKNQFGSSSAGAWQMIGDLTAAAGDVTGTDSLSQFGQRLSGGNAILQKEAKQKLEAIGTNPNAALAFVEEGVSGAITNIAPYFVVGPTLAVSAMVGQVVSDEYGTGRAAGLKPGDALARATAMGAAEFIGERASLPTPLIKGFKDLIKGLPAEQILPAFAKYLVKENVAEQVTTALNFGTDKWASFGITPNATLADYLQAVGDTLYQTTAQTLVMGGAGKVAAPIVRRLTEPTSPEGILSKALNEGIAGTEFNPEANDALARRALDVQSYDANIISPTQTARVTRAQSILDQATTVEDMTGAANELAGNLTEMLVPDQAVTPLPIIANEPMLTSELPPLVPGRIEPTLTNEPLALTPGPDVNVETEQQFGLDKLRMNAPRPQSIQGKPAASLTDDELSTTIADSNVSAITRRSAEVELKARQAEQAPPTTATTANAPAATTAIPDVTGTLGSTPVRGGAAAPVSELPGADTARANAQRAIDRWSATQGVASPIQFNPAPAEETAAVSQIGQALNSQFGTRLFAYHDTNPTAPNGVAIAGTAFVNTANVAINVGRTSLHEFKHTIEQIAKAEADAGLTNTPAQQFTTQIDSIFDDMTDAGKRAYVENFLHADELAGITDPAAREARVQELIAAPMTRSEMTADFLGSRATDKKFWADVAKADPQGFKGFVDKWLGIIDGLLAKLRGRKDQGKYESARVDKYVQDLNRAKMVARDALVAYRKGTLQQFEGATNGPANNVAAGNQNIPGIATSARPELGQAGRAEVPSYGTGRQGAISVIGRHYSSSPQQSLSGAYYGRGLKGAERNRLDSSTDPRLKNRIYFYVDQGSGIRPESGVGGYAHEVKLDNIYDPQTGTIRPQADLNGFESAVINAGFDGYIAPFGNNQAAVVLLGQKHKAVPVAQIGQPTSAPLPQAAAPTTLKKGLLSREANTIDVSKIPGAKMRMGSLEIPAEQTEAANAELERIGSDVRFSAKQSNAATLEKELSLPTGVTLSLEDYTDSEVELANLEAVEQNQGAGSEAMRQLTRAADRNGVNLMLIPAGDRVKRERLADFYGRFGFQEDGDVMRRPAAAGPSFAKKQDIPEGIDNFARLENIIPRARAGSYNTNRELKVALQTAILAAAKNAKINLAEQNAQTEQYLTRVGVADAIYALQANANAVGWYDKTVTKALKVLGKIHPEINTDPNAKFAFTWALAVTSNGLKVDKNFELAEQAYRAYKNTGRMPSNIEAGQAQGAINKSLDLFNQMVAQYGIDNVRKFMDSKFAVSQIKRATGLEVTGEFAETLVRGAAVLGPKIGNGFYANLNGFFDQLTMDRWLMRTWGRWTGTLIEARPDMVKLKREELRNFVVKMKQNAPAAAEFQKALGAKLTVGDLDGLAKAIQKASMDPDTRKIFNKTPEGEGLRLNGNSLAKYLDGQKEAPDGPEERNFIRKVFGQILKEVQKEHPALTMSDLQALLWYPEKRLYDIAKSEESANQEEGYSDDEAPDYANAASKLARDLGVSDADIQSAGAEAEKDYASRISTGTAGRGTGEQAAPGAAPAVRGFAERESREFLTTGVIRGIRSAGTSDTGQPNSYTRKSGGDGKGLRVLGIPSVAVYSPATIFKNALAEIPVTPPKFFEVGANGATVFRDSIQEAKANSRFGAAVYVYPADEYAGMRLFLTEDGKAGFALKGDDIVSVFAGKEHPGAANSVLQLATQEGGRRLDAFDTVLPNMYALHGFRAVARTKWNDDYAPDGWNKDTFKEFNNGKPDVVFMVHDPEYFDAYTHADGPVIAEYDDGAKAQAEALANIKQVRQTDPPKPVSALSIFTGLDKRGLAKAKAETLLAEHPDSARIKYVQENFLDILSELEDSDLVKINCD
jgi:hypothetical protein